MNEDIILFFSEILFQNFIFSENTKIMYLDKKTL